MTAASTVQAVPGGKATRAPRLHVVLLSVLLPPLLMSLAGCAADPAGAPTATAADLQWVASGAGLLADNAAPLETPDSLMRISDEMRAFAEAATAPESTDYGKVRALSHALAQVRHMHYDAEATLSAEEAFRQQRANCLSYTLLFIALARSVSINAQFNEVDVPPVWDLGDDQTSLLYRHINARVDLWGLSSSVVDVSDDYNPNYPQRLVADEVAQAQFYNNRSVELRLRHQPLEALRYEVRALQLAPEAAFLWTNLAELYLQQDQARAARIAIGQSLRLDGGDMLAYDTAVNIYARGGDTRLAAGFRVRARDFREHNPYYHYQLGLAALRSGDKDKARDEVTLAIQLYPADARFHFLMAVVLADMGQAADAEQSLNNALTLSPDSSQQERYKSKFARLAQQG
jgi:tetratricopeptide (TPR) repeat protein